MNPEAGRFPPDKLGAQIAHVHLDDLKSELRDFNKTRCTGPGVVVYERQPRVRCRGKDEGP